MSTSFHPVLCSVFTFFFFSHPSSSLPYPSFMNSILVSDYVVSKTSPLFLESVTQEKDKKGQNEVTLYINQGKELVRSHIAVV